MREEQPRLLLAAKVMTMHPDTRADFAGVVVQGDRIMRLVRPNEVAEVRETGIEVTDLGHRTLLPGFVDVHAHAEVACRAAYGTVDCRAPECGSISDILDALSSASPEEGWLIGQGNLFLDRKLKDGRLPTKAELDSVSRDAPIALRAGGHITVLNSKALEIAGIDRNYVSPDYSVTGLPDVVREENGEPTGVVKEMDTLLPFPSFDKARLKAALREGLARNFTRYGVTTIGEISETIEGIGCMDEMEMDGELPVSMRIYLWSPGTMPLEDACDWKSHFTLNSHDSAIRIQGLKIFSDGGFSAKSAAITCPYIGAGDRCGDIAFSKYFFRRAYELTQAAGLQLAVHANGDRAQEWLSQLVIDQGGTSQGRTRMRIEHAGNFLPRRRTRDLWAKAGIIPVPQPVFIYTFGEYFPDYIGPFGAQGRFPFRSLIEEGWRLSGSSDVWIGSEREATNPMFSVWCCVKRETYSGGFIDPHEALSVEQALRLHTFDAAATMGEDDVKGSLAPGKYADIIALEADPTKVEVDRLRHLKTEYVMVRGKTVLNETA